MDFSMDSPCIIIRVVGRQRQFYDWHLTNQMAGCSGIDCVWREGRTVSSPCFYSFSE